MMVMELISHFFHYLKHGSQLLGFVAALTTPLIVSQGNLESLKELLMMRVPSILWRFQIGSWVGLVKLGHTIR